MLTYFPQHREKLDTSGEATYKKTGSLATPGTVRANFATNF